MSADLELSKFQISKIIQSDGIPGKTSGNLDKNVLSDLSVPLGKVVSPKLAIKATSSVLNKFSRKITGQGAVMAGRGLNLFIINEYMSDILKIVELL